MGETVVSGLKSETGTTATLESSYVAVSLGSGDVVTAGFTLTPKDGSPFEVAAVVDAGSSSFKAEAAGLVANTDYTCVAWACLNGGARVEGLPTTFRPTVSEPVTIVADFSSNALWGLPESNSAMEQKEVSVTDNDGYTWKIFGGCINGGCLWLACQSKSKFSGYVILPQPGRHDRQVDQLPERRSEPVGQGPHHDLRKRRRRKQFHSAARLYTGGVRNLPALGPEARKHLQGRECGCRRNQRFLENRQTDDSGRIIGLRPTARESAEFSFAVYAAPETKRHFFRVPKALSERKLLSLRTRKDLLS
ncbi:MAG: hypothetical protein ACLSCF_07840 [Alistipes finegoldii]